MKTKGHWYKGTVHAETHLYSVRTDFELYPYFGKTDP